MKNILFLIESSGHGGAEQVVADLISNLDRNEYNPFFFTRQPGWLSDATKNIGIPTYYQEQNAFIDWKILKRLFIIIKEQNIHIIHAHEFLMNFYGTILSKITGLPCVATVHGKHHYPKKYKRILIYRWISKNAYLVVVSDELRRFLIEKIKIKKNHIGLVYNGIKNHLDKQKSGFKESLGIKSKEFVVLTVANLYEGKGYQYLIKAAEILNTKFSDIKFIFVGKGHFEKKLKKMVQDNNLSDKIVFLGYREDVKELLKIADVFVLPSLSEGLPISVLEALRAEKAVIATNVGGIPEIIENNKSGIIVPAKNVEFLSNKIELLKNNTEFRNRIAAEGYRIFQEKFKLENMINNYQDIYFKEMQK